MVKCPNCRAEYDEGAWKECPKCGHVLPCQACVDKSKKISKLESAIKEALDEDCGGHAQVILVEALGYDPRTEDR